jgi:rubrerythrin
MPEPIALAPADRLSASREEVFKCRTCGAMFPTFGAAEGTCPVCGTLNRRPQAEVLEASREEF